jgi:hypothetical protein
MKSIDCKYEDVKKQPEQDSVLGLKGQELWSFGVHLDGTPAVASAAA